MLDLVSIIGAFFTAKEVIKEKREPVVSKGTYFDWNEYWADVKNGMTATEQIKKRQNGGYTKFSCSANHKNNKNNNFDSMKYEHDKALYGETIAEIWKKNGSYRR